MDDRDIEATYARAVASTRGRGAHAAWLQSHRSSDRGGEADDFLRADDAAIAEALRKTNTAAVREVRFTTDHSYSDHRIALQATLLRWLEGFEPGTKP
jgi:hypothetical protein